MNPVALKRIPKEIAATKDLSGVGIYYIHDEDSLLRGHAMIFGPEGTPYAFCPLFFRIEFPTDYPFSPPKVTFLTSDGRTRFHPNLYVEGKVCLSILGTWNGPSWQSTMSLSMVLVSLQALLDENPLRNEPGFGGISKSDEKGVKYSKILQYKLIAHTLSEYRSRHFLRVFEEEAADTIRAEFHKLQELIRSKQNDDIEILTNGVYGIQAKLDWKLLLSNSNGTEIEESRL